jgi:long-chain acyl-CoA synthetase
MSICVYADPNQYKPIAIVVPVEATLSKLAIAKGFVQENTWTMESLVEDKKIIDTVFKELLSVGKRGGLMGSEIIQGLALVSEEWTPENVLCS